MAKQQQQIRIKLKAYDNYVVDESARKIAETVIKTQAKVKGPITSSSFAMICLSRTTTPLTNR